MTIFFLFFERTVPDTTTWDAIKSCMTLTFMDIRKAQYNCTFTSFVKTKSFCFSLSHEVSMVQLSISLLCKSNDSVMYACQFNSECQQFISRSNSLASTVLNTYSYYKTQTSLYLEILKFIGHHAEINRRGECKDIYDAIPLNDNAKSSRRSLVICKVPLAIFHSSG